MILGAQMFSMRDKTGTADGMRETFRRVAEMGYECVQVSGGFQLPAEEFAALSEKYHLPIVSTHTPLNRIIEETDAVIREHKIFGSNQIGLGGMPIECRDSVASVRKFIESLKEPVRKMKAAGMTFAYHNHNFEFFPLEDTCIYDILLAETDWCFTPDVYWMTFAGVDPVATLRRLAGRTTHIHLKDMADTPERGITACGTGIIDFKPIIALAEEIGVISGLVEQDNAPDLGDSYEQMRIGAEKMLPQVHHK